MYSINNIELKKLYILQTEAEQLAAALIFGTLGAGHISDRVKRLELLADKARIRLERRYQAIRRYQVTNSVCLETKENQQEMPGTGHRSTHLKPRAGKIVPIHLYGVA